MQLSLDAEVLPKAVRDFNPEWGIVLGSGLGGVADRIDAADGGSAFDTAALPHWPRSTVQGHAGKLANPMVADEVRRLAGQGQQAVGADAPG